MSTRENILEKAGQLIYHKGYLATSISDIMAAAEVGKGQLYHYFPSKKAIGLEVIQNLLNQWRQELLDGILQGDEPGQVIAEMIDWFFDFHQQQTVYYGCPVGNLIVELSTQEADFQQLLEAFMTDWVKGLTAVLQKKSPDLAAEACQSQALTIIANLQGGAILVKVQQDIHSLALLRHRLLTEFA